MNATYKNEFDEEIEYQHIEWDSEGNMITVVVARLVGSLGFVVVSGYTL